jgi:hypothetical protein
VSGAAGGNGTGTAAPGNGGGLRLKAGNSGASGGVGGTNGGDATLNGGAPSAGGVSGKVLIGQGGSSTTGTTSAIGIGLSTITTTVTGTLQMDTQSALGTGTYTTAQLPGICTDGWLAWDSTTTQVKRCKTNVWSAFTVGAVDFNFSAFDSLVSTTLIAPLSQTTVANASTLAGATFTTEVAGVGGGNYVEKLCSDGATCAAPSTYATCTLACTAAAGTVTGCTINIAVIPAATTLSWSGITACASNNPAFNVNAHFTNP